MESASSERSTGDQETSDQSSFLSKAKRKQSSRITINSSTGRDERRSITITSAKVEPNQALATEDNCYTQRPIMDRQPRSTAVWPLQFHVLIRQFGPRSRTSSKLEGRPEPAKGIGTRMLIASLPLQPLQPLFSSPSCTHRAPGSRPPPREGSQIKSRWWCLQPLLSSPSCTHRGPGSRPEQQRASLRSTARSSLGGAWWWDEQQETTLRPTARSWWRRRGYVQRRSESAEPAIAYDYSAWDTWTPGITASSATTSANAHSGSSDASAPGVSCR
ncbi:hypothetical protein V8F33_009591 [Rhypophila sp. PSN 637]